MKKLLIYIAAFAMILAMNTSCEDMGSLEEHPKKVDATTFMIQSLSDCSGRRTGGLLYWKR